MKTLDYFDKIVVPAGEYCIDTSYGEFITIDNDVILTRSRVSGEWNCNETFIQEDTLGMSNNYDVMLTEEILQLPWKPYEST